MSQKTFIEVEDSEALAFGEVGTSLSTARRAGQPVIQIRAYRRPIGSEETSSPDDDVPVSIGELAVLLVARFTLPRMKMLAQGRRGLNPAPASAHDPWEE